MVIFGFQKGGLKGPLLFLLLGLLITIASVRMMRISWVGFMGPNQTLPYIYGLIRSCLRSDSF